MGDNPCVCLGLPYLRERTGMCRLRLLYCKEKAELAGKLCRIDKMGTICEEDHRS